MHVSRLSSQHKTDSATYVAHPHGRPHIAADIYTAARAYVSGADQGAERAENRASVSGAVSGHSTERLSGNGAWRGRLRSESGCHKKAVFES